MPSVNKVIIIGHLGKDPDTRYLPNGDPVCNISVATSESWKDKTGEKQEKTEWHNVVMYRKLAEIAGQYLTKGALVYIEGRIQTRKWQDKEGRDRYTTELISDRMQMLGSASVGAPREQRGNSQEAPQQSSGPRSYFDDFEDDIP